MYNLSTIYITQLREVNCFSDVVLLVYSRSEHCGKIKPVIKGCVWAGRAFLTTVKPNWRRRDAGASHLHYEPSGKKCVLKVRFRQAKNLFSHIFKRREKHLRNLRQHKNDIKISDVEERTDERYCGSSTSLLMILCWNQAKI